MEPYLGKQKLYIISASMWYVIGVHEIEFNINTMQYIFISKFALKIKFDYGSQNEQVSSKWQNSIGVI